MKEYRQDIRGRFDVVPVTACANPTPGSVRPTLQAARYRQYYTQFTPAAITHIQYTLSDRV